MVNLMTKVELSLWIEANYPATAVSFVMRKPVYGAGINDANYSTQPTVNGRQLIDPAYIHWSRMIERAYSNEMKDRQPTYDGITVSTEWSSFVAFRKWWLVNYREGWQLDKDLLVVGNREYCKDFCVYIPSWLNKFTTDSGSSRGEYPIGVYKRKTGGKYASSCRDTITGKPQHLGLFTTPEAAHQAWLNYKLALAEQLKPEMDAIDVRIYPNVVTIIKAA